MIALLGMCFVAMALLHWFVEPLEAVMTAALQLRFLPWVLLGLLVWIFAGEKQRDETI